MSALGCYYDVYFYFSCIISCRSRVFGKLCHQFSSPAKAEEHYNRPRSPLQISQPSAGRQIPRPSSTTQISKPSAGTQIPQLSAGVQIPRHSSWRHIPQASTQLPRLTVGTQLPRPSARTQLLRPTTGMQPPQPLTGTQLPRPSARTQLLRPTTGMQPPQPLTGTQLIPLSTETQIPRPSARTQLLRPSTGTQIPRPSTGAPIPRPSTGAQLGRLSTETQLPQPSAGTQLPQPSAGTQLLRPSAGALLPQPSTGRQSPLHSASATTATAIGTCHLVLQSLQLNEQLEVLSILFSNISAHNVPADFLGLTASGMQNLSDAGQSNIIYSLARGLGTRRRDDSDSLLPVKRMPMGLIEYAIAFFTASSVQKVKAIFTARLHVLVLYLCYNSACTCIHVLVIIIVHTCTFMHGSQFIFLPNTDFLPS